jgi:hypothetical protein
VPIYLKDGLAKTEGMEEIAGLWVRSISLRMEFIPNGIGPRELPDVVWGLGNLPSEIGL